MTTLRDAIQDLAAMAKRGAISDEELKRLMGFMSQSTPVQEKGESEFNLASDTRPESGSPSKRSYARRGKSGWVDKKRARDLDLVALMELGGTARRPELLTHIDKRWGQRFTEADKEILNIAKEPRWEKTCQWGLHSLTQDGPVVRPEWGVQSLTSAGASEARSKRSQVN